MFEYIRNALLLHKPDMDEIIQVNDLFRAFHYVAQQDSILRRLECEPIEGNYLSSSLDIVMSTCLVQIFIL